MKKLFFINMILFFIISNTNTAFSEEKRYNHEIEFGTSSAERILQFNGNGSVNITGYNGDKVLFSSNENIFEKEDSKVDEKTKGLTKIGGGGFNIINNKQNNIIIISRPIGKNIDLDVKVPNNITLRFGSEIALQPAPISLAGVGKNGNFEGDISIKDFSGILEASTVKGSITAENMDGEVIASTVEGKIHVAFKTLNKDKPLYFSTIGGDIDITFPKDTNADIMSRTVQGDIYSGFDGDIVHGDRATNKETKGVPQSTDSIYPSNYIATRINNGGQKIYINTISGNIYIRKGNGVAVAQSRQSTTPGKWTWVSGDSKTNQRGVYGVKGVAASTNMPGARSDSISWIDSKGNLWLFGGHNGIGIWGSLNDLWKFDGTNWTWVSGDSNQNQPGVYGAKGVAAGTNKPGARSGGTSWIDSKGNLWLFGGYGYADTRTQGSLNDLWKFDGTQWTWVSGDNEFDQAGVYGSKGVAAATNKPGARRDSISWTDSAGNLWLFGGYRYYQYGAEKYLNDLWKFDGTNWIWVSGDSTLDEVCVYGTKGVADGRNKPGARSDSISWIDSKGNLWLFGGYGIANISWKGGTENLSGRNPFAGYLNDLWKFDGAAWTWVSGDKEVSNLFGFTSADKIEPSARFGSISWTDSNGNFWLFGGYTPKGYGKSLNDLWKFDGTNWTLVSGDTRGYQRGVYGVKGVAAGTNQPGPRSCAISWIDGKGNLWLFGGQKNGSEFFNDLWKFEP